MSLWQFKAHVKDESSLDSLFNRKRKLMLKWKSFQKQAR